jgi:3D (Asp-Asp-Asp) domain-containing protein
MEERVALGKPDQFEVIAKGGLNLRSEPVAKPDNIIETLPKGHQVTKLGETSDENWWKVKASFEGENLIGFVAKRFLLPLADSPAEGFNFLEPSDKDRSKSLTLWSTFYNVHVARNASDGNPLLDPAGNNLGCSLSDEDWCNAAVEGTVTVLDESGSSIGTYNFVNSVSTEQVDCSRFFPSLPPSTIRGTNSARFNVSRGSYGDGINGFILVPYRTIAIDPAFISIGSVIYIPDARGKTVVLPSGKSVSHDGYFFGADVGDAINDNHIDVFLGISTKSPFPFIQGRKDSTFSAFLISDSQTIQGLKAMHRI